jgi:hypothetical protein
MWVDGVPTAAFTQFFSDCTDPAPARPGGIAPGSDGHCETEELPIVEGQEPEYAPKCSDRDCAGIGPCPAIEDEICNNGVDDDQNGSTDCADPLCASTKECNELSDCSPSKQQTIFECSLDLGLARDFAFVKRSFASQFESGALKLVTLPPENPVSENLRGVKATAQEILTSKLIAEELDLERRAMASKLCEWTPVNRDNECPWCEACEPQLRAVRTHELSMKIFQFYLQANELVILTFDDWLKTQEAGRSQSVVEQWNIAKERAQTEFREVWGKLAKNLAELQGQYSDCVNSNCKYAEYK